MIIGKFEITPFGFIFPYHDDRLEYIWPWVRSPEERRLKICFLSHDNPKPKGFISLNDYWMFRGKEEGASLFDAAKGQIQGYVWETDILNWWVKTKLKLGWYVVIYNINVGARDSNYWSKMPKQARVLFNKDVVIICCDKEADIKSICDSIEPQFANAVGVRNGQIIYWNEDEEVA